MIKTGSEELDKLIGGYDEKINYIYGPPSSGKTTLCKLALIEQLSQKKKVIFIDTENGFSLDRFKQLTNNNYKELLDNLILIKVKNFDDQCKKLEAIRKLKNIKLVIIDSLGNYYREKVRENPKEINNKLILQLHSLRELTKNNTSIILTNQVYSSIKENIVIPVGGEMVKKFCKKIIELEIKPRKLIQIRPEKKEMLFKVENTGIIIEEK
ncbi:AAA family ATPase [Candidatus Woesearchaeota archaeon]|nr:AAA family ATPase [Candidatus Woesearchaeota archaeon]